MDLWYHEEEIARVDELVSQWKEEIGNGIDVEYMRYDLLNESLKKVQQEHTAEYYDECYYDEECESDCYDDEDDVSIVSEMECDTPVSSPTWSEASSTHFDSWCCEEEYTDEECEEQEDFCEDSCPAFGNIGSCGLLCDFELINNDQSKVAEASNSSEASKTTSEQQYKRHVKLLNNSKEQFNIKLVCC